MTVCKIYWLTSQYFFKIWIFYKVELFPFFFFFDKTEQLWLFWMSSTPHLFFYETKTCYNTHPEFQFGNTATKQACCYGNTRTGTSEQLPKIQSGMTSTSFSIPSNKYCTAVNVLALRLQKILVRVLFGLYFRKRKTTKKNKIYPSPILPTQDTFVTFHFFFIHIDKATYCFLRNTFYLSKCTSNFFF